MVARREALGWTVLRWGWLLGCAVAALLVIGGAAKSFDGPTAPIWRYRSADPPRVIVRGTVRTVANPELDEAHAVCVVQHETLQRCGKSSCWRPIQGMHYSRGLLTVTSSSSPVPSELVLGTDFRIDPGPPDAKVVTGPRRDFWGKTARASGLGFKQSDITAPNHRVVERCIAQDEPVVVEGCLAGGVRIGACVGEPVYGLTRGATAEAANDNAADNVALRLGIGFGLLLAGVLALVRGKGTLVDALAQRAGAPKAFGTPEAVALVVVPVALLVNLLFYASSQPSTYAWVRWGGFASITAIASWFLLMRHMIYRRRLAAAALAPVLATETKPLASASGTVELSVRARRSGDGVAPFLDEASVAFVATTVREQYKSGKNTSTRELLVVRPRADLEVVDDSGEGVLHLENAVLDVEVRKLTMKLAPPRFAERGIVLDLHPDHVSYQVEERIIRDGEPLYVLGEVSNVTLQHDERSYRAVRGSPTLGSADAPPVLVFAGDERGLVASVAAEARHANGLAILAGAVLALLAAATGWLALL